MTGLLDEQVFESFHCLFFLIEFCIVEVLKIFEIKPIIEKLWNFLIDLDGLSVVQALAAVVKKYLEKVGLSFADDEQIGLDRLHELSPCKL